MGKIIDANKSFKKHNENNPYHPNIFINFIKVFSGLLAFAAYLGIFVGVFYIVLQWVISHW